MYIYTHTHTHNSTLVGEKQYIIYFFPLSPKLTYKMKLFSAAEGYHYVVLYSQSRALLTVKTLTTEVKNYFY